MTTTNWTTHPTVALRAGAGFDLSTLDHRATPGWPGDKADGVAHMAAREEQLDDLQERLFANGRVGDKRRVLLILQGLDTSGKGGIVRHVLGMVDPQGVHVANFGVPTKEELSHHFLWRVIRKLPPPGKICVFDRSHYEDVLVARVDGLVSAAELETRYEEINNFEETLTREGYALIKVALMHSHREQGLRLAERLARGDKWWKYSPSDVDTRLKWDAYQEAYQAMFDRTSTDHAPWYVVLADRKWYARLAVTELLIHTLAGLNQEWPTPTWNLDAERERLLATMHPDDVAAAQEALSAERKL
ncbi:PPK2 family polyphosphate kinase [Trueperella bialowiezensis]|uniref:Polyphosphate:nucleotide phosphotransferase, PPK2 family n=1 Tax=Trueperella bialowiezensis TaxID=312285 RepID=A0A3S4UYI4_9ACTO|nr:PPK2 family polyphosphate kinase [Trueperella bialowiezensis]VEI12993.1 polyphosphate:nucleotide phosphotransferase, PPK2 family [Trueperella bialowiezensis]